MLLITNLFTLAVIIAGIVSLVAVVREDNKEAARRRAILDAIRKRELGAK